MTSIEPITSPILSRPPVGQETEELAKKRQLQEAWETLTIGQQGSIQPLQEQLPRGVYQTSDVKVFVDVALESPEDQTDSKRLELAEDVQEIIDDVLYSEHFSSPSLAKLLLHVRVVHVSGGSKRGKICGAEIGYGDVKLAVLWCLQRADTGEIIVGERLIKTDHLGFGIEELCFFQDAGPGAVRRMAHQLADKLASRVESLING